MAEKQKSAAAPILAVFVVASALFGAYVAGYVFMADLAKTNASNQTIRCYPYPWQVDAFTPLGRAEASVRGGTVQLATTRQMKGLSKDRPVQVLKGFFDR